MRERGLSCFHVLVYCCITHMRRSIRHVEIKDQASCLNNDSLTLHVLYLCNLCRKQYSEMHVGYTYTPDFLTTRHVNDENFVFFSYATSAYCNLMLLIKKRMCSMKINVFVALRTRLERICSSFTPAEFSQDLGGNIAKSRIDLQVIRL